MSITRERCWACGTNKRETGVLCAACAAGLAPDDLCPEQIAARASAPDRGAANAFLVDGWGVPHLMAVPKNARNKEGGWRYVDAMLDVRGQAAFAARMGYGPTVTDAPLPADLARQISLTEAQQAKLRTPDYAYQASMAGRLLDFWNKEFKG